MLCFFHNTFAFIQKMPNLDGIILNNVILTLFKIYNRYESISNERN